MIETSRARRMAALVAATTLGWPGAAGAQPATQPGVDQPRIELAAVARLERMVGANGERRWSSPGLAVTVDRTVSRHLAAAVQVETDFRDAIALLGGVQMSTGFYYGSSRDPVPGRFFARTLAGVARDGSEARRPAGQLVAGADILLSRTHPVGLRWEVGYDLSPGAAAGAANGRVAIGLLLGRCVPRHHTPA